MPLRALTPTVLWLVTAASPAPPPLNWSAPNRWVHVDTVAQEGIPVFEGARRRWLETLRRDGPPLPDGRPLFWSGDHGRIRTYLTFYPFAEFADLDARARVASETQTRVGKAAVADYDTGDVALIPPHYTQVWRRSPDDDFVSPVAGDIGELTARHGRIQLQQLNLQIADGSEENWRAVKDALAKQRHPLTCRLYVSRFGVGQTIRLWLAADAESLRRAPALAEALRRALGDEKGAALARQYGALWSTQEEFELVRREDLSNLAP